MKRTIDVSKGSVMAIVEGISVTIAQHNNGTPSFEQLWASSGDVPKLDIYYREAINDLELTISKWLISSSSQFDLQQAGKDYHLEIDVADSWPLRLSGLLANKIQDYLVHCITAGWLNDFEGLSVKQDYQAMGASDLSDILYIITQKELGFAEQVRTTEAFKEQSDEDTTSISERGQDATKITEETSAAASMRAGDSDKVEATDSDSVTERSQDTSKPSSNDETALSRTSETEKIKPNDQQTASSRAAEYLKTDSDVSQKAGSRGGDNAKDTNTFVTNASARTVETMVKADVTGQAVEVRHDAGDHDKANGQSEEVAASRQEDNTTICKRCDWTDWSGTHCTGLVRLEE
jgi:hypothetical protein